MRARRILLLGGTGEARELAAALIALGHDVVSSLAGVTQSPLLPDGAVRRGGFGGQAGLEAFIRERRIELIADATHPFAKQISQHACAAARSAGIACLRLERPAWAPMPGDNWISAGNVEEAAALLPYGAVVFAAIGRKEIGVLFDRADLSGVARMIESPVGTVPPRWTVMQERPPFAVEAERRLMEENGISHLVSRNAGASDSHAKLVAARICRLPVVMIARPVKPAVPVFPDVASLARAAGEQLLP